MSKAGIIRWLPTSTQVMPRNAVSMPSVAAIGSALNRTMAIALMPPITRQMASVTAAAPPRGQPLAIR